MLVYACKYLHLSRLDVNKCFQIFKSFFSPFHRTNKCPPECFGPRCLFKSIFPETWILEGKPTSDPRLCSSEVRQQGVGGATSRAAKSTRNPVQGVFPRFCSRGAASKGPRHSSGRSQGLGPGSIGCFSLHLPQRRRRRRRSSRCLAQTVSFPVVLSSCPGF